MNSQTQQQDYKVGASVLTMSGNMYQGCSIDVTQHNGGYSQGLCAEDCAIFKALSEGQSQIKAIAVHVKHLIKDESLTHQVSPNQASLISQGGLTIISPRLKQTIMEQEIFNVPELQRQGSSLPNLQFNDSMQRTNSIQKRYRAVFQTPNGQWRNNSTLIKANSHFLLISCKSDRNFIIKTSATLLPLMPCQRFDAPNISNLLMKDKNSKVNYPDIKIPQEILEAAVYYTQIDFNEETRFQTESLIQSNNIPQLAKIFGSRLCFTEPGIVVAKYGCGYNRINFVTAQLLAHGMCEYLFEKFDRNELANQGILIAYDSRYESFGLAQLMAAVFKAYQIRVFCLDRYAVVPFVSYFSMKFKSILGVMVTGQDYSKSKNGMLIFNKMGQLIDQETSKGIERAMKDYILQQNYLVDLSQLYDYSSKKVKFKPDNFSDVTMKSYIQSLEEQFLINQRKTNKLSQKIIFTGLHGPSTDYMRKIFANFGFPNIIVPENQQLLSHEFETVIIPSTSLQKLVIKQAIIAADQNESNYIICADPTGQSLLFAERIIGQEIQNKDQFHIYQSNEIAIILIDGLISQLRQTGSSQNENLYIICDIQDTIIQEFCTNQNVQVLYPKEKLPENSKFIMKVDLVRSRYGFNPHLQYDALNAIIILSQLLVCLQIEEKSMYLDFKN